MKWFRVVKLNKPNFGKYYFDWKTYLAEEGRNQCVYCAIGLEPFGGIRNFHVEHYKPKGLSRFKSLEHDYNNLFFACSVCNCFKGDDWPNDPIPNLSVKCYPNPTVVNYSALFEIDKKTFSLHGRKFASKYLIERLYLNRPQLILERRAAHISERIEKTLKELRRTVKQIKQSRRLELDSEKVMLYDAVLTLVETSGVLNQQKQVVPYMQNQIKK